MSNWNGNRFSIYANEEKSTLKLIEELGKQTEENLNGLKGKTDLYGDHKGSWQGLSKPTLSEEGMRATVEKLDNEVNEINAELLKRERENTIKTAENYGCVGDGVADDSDKLLQAMLDCASKGYTLQLRGKYKITKPLVYNGDKSLLIVGSRPNYNSLLKDILPLQEEQCNIVFDNGGTLEINKMGSVTFFSVGFGSTSLEYGTGILLKSFHNKFINCSFTQFNKAITFARGWNNWLGENQILYCGFYKCEYCVYSEDGSDSEFIGNLVHGSCNVGFYGESAGWTFALNHFYGKKPNYFKYFNTKIVDNYIQEMPTDEPSIILDGTFGCLVGTNNFELNNDTDKTAPKGLIGITLNNGKGNINIIGNSIHGKTLKTVDKLAFIKLIYTTTRYDMPLTISSNNLRGCKALFTEHYPSYNIKGSSSYKNIEIGFGVTPSIKNIEVVNGMCYAYGQIQNPTIANLFRFSNSDVPVVATLNLRNKNTSAWTTKQYFVETGQWLAVSDYASYDKVDMIACYPVSHSSEVDYKLE